MASDSMKSDPIKLQNVEVKNGKTVVPKRRIASAEDAQALVINLIEANSERSRFNAKIKGCIDGNPPYNPAKLRAAGQAYRANVNFMEFDAAVSAALVPYYDLFSGSRYYAEVKTYRGKDPDERERFSRIITEEFDKMLKEFDGFDFNIQSMLNDYIVFGRGFTMWEDTFDWIFTHVPQHRIYVPDGTECSTEKLEVLVIRSAYRVHQLWKHIRNRSAADARGWKTENTARAMMDASQEQANDTSQTGATYELLQQKITDRDLSESMRSNVVKVAHLFVREFDNSITHMIVEEEAPKRTQGKARTLEFLYYKENEYKKFNQAVATFFFETRDGSWNGTLGFGRKNYSAYEVKNRMWNTAIDNVFLRSGITLQARSQSAIENTALVQVGALSILPPDYEVQQASIYGDVESQIAMNRAMDGMLTSNTGIYRPKLDQPSGNPRTATEIQAQFSNNATLTNSAVNRFYSQLDKFYRELYRRAVASENYSVDGAPLAKQFMDACRARGVPDFVIKDSQNCITACRTMGNGSIYMRQQSVTQTAPLVPMFNEKGRKAWLDDSIAAYAGYGAVERWNPQRPEDQLPDDQAALAVMENGLLASGAPVQWTPTNNDLIHAQVHLQGASQAAASIEQGGDPVKIVAALDMFGPHIGIHIEELSKDPSRKSEVQLLTEQVKQLAAITDQIREQIAERAEEQAEAAAESQEAAGEMSLDSAKLAHDMKLKEAKSQQALRQKEEKHRQQMALADAKTAFSIQQMAAKQRATEATAAPAK